MITIGYKRNRLLVSHTNSSSSLSTRGANHLFFKLRSNLTLVCVKASVFHFVGQSNFMDSHLALGCNGAELNALLQ